MNTGSFDQSSTSNGLHHTIDFPEVRVGRLDNSFRFPLVVMSGFISLTAVKQSLGVRKVSIIDFSAIVPHPSAFSSLASLPRSQKADGTGNKPAN